MGNFFKAGYSKAVAPAPYPHVPGNPQPRRRADVPVIKKKRDAASSAQPEPRADEPSPSEAAPEAPPSDQESSDDDIKNMSATAKGSIAEFVTCMEKATELLEGLTESVAPPPKDGETSDSGDETASDKEGSKTACRCLPSGSASSQPKTKKVRSDREKAVKMLKKLLNNYNKEWTETLKTSRKALQLASKKVKILQDALEDARHAIEAHEEGPAGDKPKEGAYFELWDKLGGPEAVKSKKNQLRSQRLKHTVEIRRPENEEAWKQDAMFAHTSLEDLLKIGEEVILPLFTTLMKELVKKLQQKIPGLKLTIAPIKGFERADEKCTTRYGGDSSQVSDIVRGTITVPIPKDDDPSSSSSSSSDSDGNGGTTRSEKVKDRMRRLYKVISRLIHSEMLCGGSVYVSYFDDRFLRDLGKCRDYADALLLIRMHGFVCELQVNFEEFDYVKQHAGHRGYEIDRKAADSLLCGAMRGELDLVRKSIKRGARPIRRLTCANHISALHYAAHCLTPDAVKMVKLLMRKGGSHFAVDDEGNIPLMRPIQYLNWPVAQLMLKEMQGSVDKGEIENHSEDLKKMDRAKLAAVIQVIINKVLWVEQGLDSAPAGIDLMKFLVDMIDISSRLLLAVSKDPTESSLWYWLAKSTSVSAWTEIRCRPELCERLGPVPQACMNMAARNGARAIIKDIQAHENHALTALVWVEDFPHARKLFPDSPWVLSRSDLPEGQAEREELLRKACESGDSKTVKACLALQTRLTPDEKGENALMITAQQIVQLARGSTEEQETEKQHENILLDLIATAADAELLRKNGVNNNFVHELVLGLQEEKAQFLLRAAKSLPSALRHLLNEMGSDERTAMRMAVREDKPWAVASLLDADADPFVVHRDGQTVLHLAAEKGSAAAITTIELVLKFEAAIQSQNGNAEASPEGTPAADGLTRPKEIDRGDNAGQTPLWRAACEGHEGAVKVLIDARAGIDIADNAGQTPLSVAAEYGREGVVQVLIDAGANYNQGNRDGETPLWRAACEGHEGVVRVLLDARADAEKADNVGKTPLRAAAYQGRAGVVKLLVDASACIDAADNNGMTPLAGAIHGNEPAVARFLIEKRADMNRKPTGGDYNGMSPIAMAIKKNMTDIAQLLRDCGAQE